MREQSSSEIWTLLVHIIEYWCQCIVLCCTAVLIICPKPYCIYLLHCQKIKPRQKNSRPVLHSLKKETVMFCCLLHSKSLSLLGQEWTLQQREFSKQFLCAAPVKKLWQQSENKYRFWIVLQNGLSNPGNFKSCSWSGRYARFSTALWVVAFNVLPTH